MNDIKCKEITIDTADEKNVEDCIFEDIIKEEYTEYHEESSYIDSFTESQFSGNIGSSVYFLWLCKNIVWKFY